MFLQCYTSHIRLRLRVLRSSESEGGSRSFRRRLAMPDTADLANYVGQAMQGLYESVFAKAMVGEADLDTMSL